MSNPEHLIICDCGQQNRLPLSIAIGKIARCGACKDTLAEDNDDLQTQLRDLASIDMSDDDGDDQ